MPPPKPTPNNTHTSTTNTTTSKSRTKPPRPQQPASTTSSTNPPSINWHTLPAPLLSRYRHAFRLDTPPAYINTRNSAVLTQGIGTSSPTMLGRHHRRDSAGAGSSRVDKRGKKVTKAQLATSVRRHFNGRAVSELDVVVELAYKVACGGRAFRGVSASGRA